MVQHSLLHIRLFIPQALHLNEIDLPYFSEGLLLPFAALASTVPKESFGNTILIKLRSREDPTHLCPELLCYLSGTPAAADGSLQLAQ